MVSFTGLSSSITLSFNLDMGHSSAAIGLEYEIAGHQNTDREPWPDGDGRRHVERSADDALAYLVDAVGPTASNGADQIVLRAARAHLRTDAQKGREDSRLEQRTPMIVDVILEPGISFRIGTRQT